MLHEVPPPHTPSVPDEYLNVETNAQAFTQVNIFQQDLSVQQPNVAQGG